MSDETLLEKGRAWIANMASEREGYAADANADNQSRAVFREQARTLRAVLAELDRLLSRVDELEARSSKEMSARASRETLAGLRKGVCQCQACTDGEENCERFNLPKNA